MPHTYTYADTGAGVGLGASYTSHTSSVRTCIAIANDTKPYEVYFKF